MEHLNDLPMLIRVALTVGMTFFFIIGLVRLAGKRSVARLNSFDWIVNVAIGSLSATAVTTPDRMIECWAAMTCFAGLQVFVTLATLHSDLFSRAVKEEPSLLVNQGKLVRSAMIRSRVNEDEILGALRAAGLGRLEDVAAMVMESQGTITTIPNSAMPEDWVSADDSELPPALANLGKPAGLSVG